MKMLLLGLLMTTTFAHAGREGNGGGSYVCINPEGKIVKASLEDFVEAKYLYKFDLETSKLDISDVKTLLRSVDPVLSNYVSNRWDDLSNEFDSSIAPVKLHKASTSNETIESVNDCPEGYESKFFTVTRYEKFGMITNENIYKKMDKKSQFGLFMHELIFEACREIYGDETSQRARGIVGSLFSSNAIEKLKKFTPQNINEYHAIGSKYATDRSNYDQVITFMNYDENLLMQKMGIENPGEKIVLDCKLEMKLTPKGTHTENYAMIAKNKDGKLVMRTAALFGLESYWGQCNPGNKNISSAKKDVFECTGWNYLGNYAVHECKIRK